MMGDPPGIKEPTTTTTRPLRVAGENKHSRARSNNTSSSPRVSSLPRARGNTSSSPKDSSLRTGQQLRSTSSSCRRFSLLSISDANSQQKPGTGLALKGLSIGTPRKHQAVTGSNGETLQKQLPGTGSNRDMLKKNRADTGASGEVLQKQRAGTGSNREMLQKNRAVTGSSGETQKEHRTKKKMGGVSSGEMLQKKYGKKRTVHKQERDANEKRRLEEEMLKNVQEADRAIQQLNELGLGEDISYQEFEVYRERLPCRPPRVDTTTEPDNDQLVKLQVRNILYHIKFCKFTLERRKNGETYNAELEDDHPLYHLEEKLECLEEDVTQLEGDHLLNYLHKEGLLRQIENDDIFDWAFPYLTVAGLDDYQRLVPQNYGGCEYEDWDTYRRYFHSYEIELEYLRFWEELLKELKWMEDYVLMKRPSLTWGKICTRGCYQAIKIASRFSNITESLARGAYYDCIDTMCLDICWYKELDGVYFEIWQGINKLKMSFRDALDSVYKLDKFSLQHHKMKDALENDDDWSEMEKEFRTCTRGITAEMTEDKARELIADGIKNQRERPKFYAQYIRKKINIAGIIGVIPTVLP
uniref:Uncharacterized protein n=1 Tax=Arundo donax TaxID=35708 RepID=A0A0A9CPQ8_ARUDO